MVRKTTLIWAGIAIAGWLVSGMLFMDNRALAGLAFAYEKRGEEWVKPSSFSKLVSVCGALSDINKEHDLLLHRAKEQLEEWDALKEINEDRLIHAGGGGDDEVRRVAGRADEGGNGGGGGIGGADFP